VLELAGDQAGASAALKESILFYELEGNTLAAARVRANPLASL
jgi:hypothetical protein